MQVCVTTLAGVIPLVLRLEILHVNYERLACTTRPSRRREAGAGLARNMELQLELKTRVLFVCREIATHDQQ